MYVIAPAIVGVDWVCVRACGFAWNLRGACFTNNLNEFFEWVRRAREGSRACVVRFPMQLKAQPKPSCLQHRFPWIVHRRHRFRKTYCVCFPNKSISVHRRVSVSIAVWIDFQIVMIKQEKARAIKPVRHQFQWISSCVCVCEVSSPQATAIHFGHELTRKTIQYIRIGLLSLLYCHII